MLESLTIQDFVIVEHLHLEFSEGMSVLSGETGAGKSILIDALSLCLGARADLGQIREGQTKATMTAGFRPTAATLAILEEQGLHTNANSDSKSDDDTLLLRRTIESNGRSKAFVNGTPVPVSTLKALSETLLDIHGQHAFQTLADPAQQLNLLDAFGQHHNHTEQTRQAWQQFSQAKNRLDHAKKNQQNREQQLQTLQWQLELLEPITPQAGQWETLSQTHNRLSHSAELQEGINQAHTQLAEQDHALLDQLSQIIDNLDRLSHKDPALTPLVKTLQDGDILIREAARDLSHYLKHSDLDPESLADVEQRLSQWHSAARKLKTPPEQLPEAFERIQNELQALQTDSNLEVLEQQLADTQAHYTQHAKQLSQKRHQAAQLLAQQVTQSMQTLSMQGGCLQIALTPSTAGPSGFDDIEFLVAGHPGVTPQPLRKVASGGELARISLAITVNTVQSTLVPTLIFDEVDSGIGGAVAETVGQYLRQLGQNRQVFCVTHLPQVAACGHHHYKVTKAIVQNQTRSHIAELSTTDRIEEIARMLGGQQITETTRATARELLRF